MQRPDHVEVRWQSHPVDSADEDLATEHPHLRSVTITKIIQTFPVTGRGISWANGVTTKVDYVVPVSDIHGLVQELVSVLTYYADGTRKRDLGIERRDRS